MTTMQAAGWVFSDHGATRVANGWMMWATDPAGKLGLQLVADPTDEPEKWPAEEPEAKDDNQMELAL